MKPGRAGKAIPMAFTLPTVPRPAGGPLCSFLAMGDWGFDPWEGGDVLIKNLAANMAAWAAAEGGTRPDFILALGDNFYDSGVSSVECVTRLAPPESIQYPFRRVLYSDPAFKERWADIFIEPHVELRVPWCIILGNHDLCDNPQAQVRDVQFLRSAFATSTASLLRSTTLAWIHTISGACLRGRTVSRAAASPFSGLTRVRARR